MKKIIGLLVVNIVCVSLFAQIPNGYYNGCGGSGTGLKLAVHNAIKKNHAVLGYASLWQSYYTTDVKPNGKLWDIYSYVYTGSQPYEYILGNNQCGQYSQEGDCYNREHTWPQSYFVNADPMVCDLHQVFPTDGTVNGIHGNNPYGNVTTANKTTMQGAKSGSSSSYPGYGGDVFEPIDSFKGDIARAYFYMNARYTTEDGGWTNWTMANGAELKTAAIKVLLAWHHLDPVSQKEIDRNEAIFNIQGNRNAFVDHPEFADCIWDTTTCEALGLEKKLATILFQIYNNTNQIFIQNNKHTHTICYQIFGFNGIVCKSNLLADDTINITELPNGIYCLRLTANNTSQTLQFIK
jgi:endonuclease I